MSAALKLSNGHNLNSINFAISLAHVKAIQAYNCVFIWGVIQSPCGIPYCACFLAFF